MFKKYLIIGLAIMTSQATLARELFETNPTTVYPPGCLSNFTNGITTPTGSRQLYAQDVVSFQRSDDASKTANVEVQIFRRGCREENRSVLYVQLSLIDQGRILVPQVSAVLGPDEYPLRLVGEPNTFDDGQTGKSLTPGTYEYIVDGMAESQVNNNSKVMLPSQYSGPFTLKINDVLDPSIEYSIVLPTWNTNIAPARIPLHGRLSGIWVVEGAEDQGFLISFSEFVTVNGTQQLIFLSWYTFGADGTMLWITAAEVFEVGDSQVVLPLELVTNGEFMGATTADREVLSDATLRVEHCNELTFTFDLSDLGLGADTVTLVRLFSLETAGYACRDVEARLDAF
jgi:hypothetical protein